MSVADSLASVSAPWSNEGWRDRFAFAALTGDRVRVVYYRGPADALGCADAKARRRSEVGGHALLLLEGEPGFPPGPRVFGIPEACVIECLPLPPSEW